MLYWKHFQTLIISVRVVWHYFTAVSFLCAEKALKDILHTLYTYGVLCAGVAAHST